MISLREAARRHDVDPGFLSRRVRDEQPAKGHELHEYARIGANGKIEGFEFPDAYEFPNGEDATRANPSPAGNKSNTKSNTESVASTAATAGAGIGLASTALDVVSKNPGQTLPALLEGGKLLGAAGVGLAAGKYVLDVETDAVDPATENAPDRGRVWPAVGVGVAAFLGTDYGLRRDESLVMRFGHWLRSQIDGESKDGSAPNPSQAKPKANGLAGALNMEMPNIDVSPN